MRDTYVFQMDYMCVLGSIFICGGMYILSEVSKLSPEALEYLRIIISVVSVAFAIYMGLRGNRRADSEEREDRIRTETRMNVKLDDVLAATKDTRDTLKDLQKDIREHNNRLVVAEQTLDNLTQRVSVIEHRLNGGN